MNEQELGTCVRSIFHNSPSVRASCHDDCGSSNTHDVMVSGGCAHSDQIPKTVRSDCCTLDKAFDHSKARLMKLAAPQILKRLQRN